MGNTKTLPFTKKQEQEPTDEEIEALEELMEKSQKDISIILAIMDRQDPDSIPERKDFY